MPRLVKISVSRPTRPLLDQLELLSGLQNSSIRVIKLIEGPAIRVDSVRGLQKNNPSLTILSVRNGLIQHVGHPVYLTAMQKLASQGIFLEGRANDGTHWSSLAADAFSISCPPTSMSVEFPSAFRFAPETAEALQPLLFALKISGRGVRNADLMASAMSLASCGGVDFQDSDLSDVGFQELKKIRNLCFVNLVGTEVSQEMIEETKRDHPELKIMSDYGVFDVSLPDEPGDSGSILRTSPSAAVEE